MRAENACALFHSEVDWNTIDWRTVNRNVRRLQVRIVKATQESRWGKVKTLQRLLTRSYSGKCIAVRRVTENRGKNTPGVDGKIWDTPAKKAAAIQNLRQRGYQPQPRRRMYIPKNSNPKKLRPLGIPTMKDRAMEALYLLALDPVAETTASLNSYGFRKERSTADAIKQCFIVLSHRKTSPSWILEGDIRACFDSISHEWLLANILIEKAILCKWLKAGYIEKRVFHPTEGGTPQGGVISPALMNLVLDGLEQELRDRFCMKNSNRPASGVNFVRYADDFIVTARSRDLLENQVRPFVEQFMSTRGLALSSEKTCITHIDDGFDFLGQNIRKYNGKLRIKPAQKNVQAFLTKIRRIIKENKTVTAGDLINRLNPVIRGWANYHQHICSSQTYRRADAAIFNALWRWAKRRHPNKGARWVRQKYFKTVGNRHWVFSGEAAGKDGNSKTIRLISASHTHIRRHIKIRAKANPYDPAWELYFEDRLRRKMIARLKGNQQLLNLWKAQNGLCTRCGQSITLETGWHIHHIIWKSKGGGNIMSNLEMLHPTCHWQIHCRDLSDVNPRPEEDVLERLEPDEVKISRPVLRGGGGSNAASLPDPLSWGRYPKNPGG